MTTSLPFSSQALLPTPSVKQLLHRAAQALARGTFPATVLVVGEAGLGREALGVELAALLICEGCQPLCPCSSCQRVRRGLHPDLQVLSVAPGHKEIRWEDVHQALEGFYQRPFEGRRRVFLLTNAHTPPLNLHAASALLKTLEEPSPSAHWVLLAANPLRVLPTIVSRAVRFHLPPPGGEELARRLPEGRVLTEAEQELVRRVPAAAALLSALERDEDALTTFQLLQQALAGELLAWLRLGAFLEEEPPRAAVAAAACLAMAQRGEPAQEEALIEAAGQLLQAQHTQEQLRVSLQALVLGRLGAYFLRQGEVRQTAGGAKK